MTARETDGPLPASFRDPSGFVYRRDGMLFRAVTDRYRKEYDRLMDSGLYAALVKENQLVAHQEITAPGCPTRPACPTGPTSGPPTPDIYKTLKPDPVPFISYPYEWCFSQLKDAAQLTLAIQQRALQFGMTLKDASAYNIQFLDGRPKLIDTLSFEEYREGEPWVAYRQFCQHFLAPLALMAHTDVRLSQLLRIHLDGIPLDLASRLLPWRTKLSPTLAAHIHLHARSQQHYADQAAHHSSSTAHRSSFIAHRSSFSKMAFLGLLGSLESAVKRLNWNPAGTEWADYYHDTNYTVQALAEKERIVRNYLEQIAPKTVWDLGANTGRFSKIASRQGILTIATDLDPAATERNYLDSRQRGDAHLLPLVLDLANPSPAIGWNNRERMSFLQRGPADAVLALALIHHLAIGNNLPLPHIARFCAELGRDLIIEYIPKSDSQVQRLLATRQDIFPDYTREAFEQAFNDSFQTLDHSVIQGSERTLYRMRRRGV